jgi:hypothetical protein
MKNENINDAIIDALALRTVDEFVEILSLYADEYYALDETQNLSGKEFLKLCSLEKDLTLKSVFNVKLLKALDKSFTNFSPQDYAEKVVYLSQAGIDVKTSTINKIIKYNSLGLNPRTRENLASLGFDIEKQRKIAPTSKEVLNAPKITPEPEVGHDFIMVDQVLDKSSYLSKLLTTIKSWFSDFIHPQTTSHKQNPKTSAYLLLDDNYDEYGDDGYDSEQLYSSGFMNIVENEIDVDEPASGFYDEAWLKDDVGVSGSRHR